MAEQVGERSSFVGSPDVFFKEHRDVNHLYFGAVFCLVLLTYGIGNYYCFKACSVDSSNGWSGKDSMHQDNINSGSST